MKKISIIWKVTIWYTIFLCILAVMVISVTYLVRDRILTQNSKNHLINLVEELANELEYEDGVLEADDDFDFIEYGVYLSVYDDENDMLFGILPRNYNRDPTYPLQTIEKILIDQQEWYVYEQRKAVGGFGDVIIRGMASVTAGMESQEVTMRILMIVSPMIILIGTIGGYMLTKQAFKPVNQMRRTVEQINCGKDLTRRIDLGDGHDEIYKLGQTFDQMLERLEDSFEREKQFSSDVSHELRTPVSVILTQCEYAMEQENGEETSVALQSIYGQTQRMSKMIGQLLMLSRSDQGMVKLHIEEIPISELLEVIVEEAREKAEQRHITITTEIEENLYMQGDETMLVRFFVNLISNAICYGNDNGWIKVRLSREENRVMGSVEDNGIGIALENQEKIWRRFYQVDPARTTNTEGSQGLGLSMVRWIVQEHGGEITLESELGKGTEFRFWFPVGGVT